MKWHWSLLIAGFGLYLLVLIPGVLSHPVDMTVTIISGMSLLSVAAFGFDGTQVNWPLAMLMIILSLAMLAAGIAAARQDHVYILLILSVPASGLAAFGLRSLTDKRKL